MRHRCVPPRARAARLQRQAAYTILYYTMPIPIPIPVPVPSPILYYSYGLVLPPHGRSGRPRPARRRAASSRAELRECQPRSLIIITIIIIISSSR